MEIDSITIQNEGYVLCESNFYSAQDVLPNNRQYTFSTGLNKLIGEIDSGNWAVSYLLSMYKHRPEDFTLFLPPQAVVNNKSISLNELCISSCYMDTLYPLFSSNNSVRDLVIQGLSYSNFDYNPNHIRDLFCMDGERFERPLAGVGNEIFKAMAAVGYCHNKEIFCFPWLSNMRFEYYHRNLSDLLKTLEQLKKVIIIPVGTA